MAVTEGDALADDWSGVCSWLNEHAPATWSRYRDPASGAAERVAALVGSELPPQVAWWFDNVGGFESYGELLVNNWLPPYEVLKSSTVSWQALWGRSLGPPVVNERVEGRLLDEDEALWVEATETGAAGGMAHAFVRPFHFLTWEGSSGFFVDLRPGPERGCVSYWSRDDGSLNPPVFRSLGDLAHQLLMALRTGTPLDAWGALWRPTVVDGEMGWLTSSNG